ncbi:MAG TPA: hypothetical protein DF614_04760 [Methylococcaceae bacterium]|nr:hypothetical protein [Methylococcaceae bacterium]
MIDAPDFIEYFSVAVFDCVDFFSAEFSKMRQDFSYGIIGIAVNITCGIIFSRCRGGVSDE